MGTQSGLSEQRADQKAGKKSKEGRWGCDGWEGP